MKLSNQDDINYWKYLAIGFIGIIAFTQFFDVNINSRFNSSTTQEKDILDLKEDVLPSDGVILPVKWGNLGKQMVEAGVIDKDKFESIYTQRGGLNEEEIKPLYGDNSEKQEINEENSGIILNLLWALGLSNKNQILEEGPIQDSRYGGADSFASTGGWSLAEGNVMKHYSKHSFITLTEEQQKLVERVSKNIYRPCCGNSTHFPDCNHGMAMLGLLELMASQGVSEDEMYKTALQVNSYWFPDVYITIARYFEKQGVSWNEINSKEVLGLAYSNAQGYRNILAEVTPPQSQNGGGSCGV